MLSRDGHILAVKAVDKDTGANGLIKYQVASPDEPYFVVDYISGAIRAKRQLDYEKVWKCRFCS